MNGKIIDQNKNIGNAANALGPVRAGGNFSLSPRERAG
jgi:hypothetical protein